MRELKFRTWSARQERYICYWGVFPNDNGSYQSGPPTVRGNVIHEQYIGLHDSKGREIYEGDRVRVIDLQITDEEGIVLQVSFDGGAFVLLDSDPRSWMNHYPISQTKNLEVIGNIHKSE